MVNYNGRFLVRMPRELHIKLAQLAEKNGVSLNTYIVFLLSRALPEPSNTEDVKEEVLKFKEKNLPGQDFNSGRRGNEIGRFLGQYIARKLGIQLEEGSNKGIYKDRVVVIKSARIKNSQFGITNRMAEDIQDVILAKEIREGHFDLFLVEFDKIRDTGRPSVSRNNRGRVTNYRVSQAISEGEKIGSIQVDLP